MLVELIFASLVAAAGGANAQAPDTPLEPAVIHETDGASRASSPRLQPAADLGCPQYYRRGHDYPPRCRRHHADPYHEGPGGRYGRYDDRQYDGRPGRYSDYRNEDRYYDGGRYDADPEFPRDTLRDRRGRPYPNSRRRDEERYAPPYRSGGYDRPAPYRARPGAFEDTDQGVFMDEPRFDRFGTGDDRVYRTAPSPYLHRSSYHGPAYKKKDTGGIAIMTGNRPADSDAGSIV